MDTSGRKYINVFLLRFITFAMGPDSYQVVFSIVGKIALVVSWFLLCSFFSWLPSSMELGHKAQECEYKTQLNVFYQKIYFSLNSQEDTCKQPPTFNFTKKETPSQVFSCDFCKNLHCSFFPEYFEVTACRV